MFFFVGSQEDIPLFSKCTFLRPLPNCMLCSFPKLLKYVYSANNYCDYPQYFIDFFFNAF